MDSCTRVQIELPRKYCSTPKSRMCRISRQRLKSVMPVRHSLHRCAFRLIRTLKGVWDYYDSVA